MAPIPRIHAVLPSGGPCKFRGCRQVVADRGPLPHAVAQASGLSSPSPELSSLPAEPSRRGRGSDFPPAPTFSMWLCR
eukprot:6715306-Alexandrium_andersonii.AAC.1